MESAETCQRVRGALHMKTAEAHFVQNGVRYFVPFNDLGAAFDRHFPAYLNCLRTFALLIQTSLISLHRRQEKPAVDVTIPGAFVLDPENGQACN